MENDNKGFPVSPGCLPGSEHQTDPHQAMFGGQQLYRKNIYKCSSFETCSGITQTVTPGYNSYPSSSGQTMSSIQSNFIASNSLPTNSKNEDLNPDHDPICLSLGKRVLHGTRNENKHGAMLQKGRDSIESMPYIGSGLREPNSNDHIFSNLQYNHPQNHVCSIQSSPIHSHSIQSSSIHFRALLCGHEEECLPHTINENSNQSFKTYQTEFTERRFLKGVVRLGPVP